MRKELLERELIPIELVFLNRLPKPNRQMDLVSGSDFAAHLFACSMPSRQGFSCFNANVRMSSIGFGHDPTAAFAHAWPGRLPALMKQASADGR